MAQLYAKKIGVYKLQKIIGKGSFATVYRGENEETHQIVAIKMIETKNIEQDKIEAIEKEISVLQSLKHPNIVEFLDLRKTKNHWYLVFEYCENGDLEKYVRSNYVIDQKTNKFRVPEDIVKKVMSQLVGAFKLMKEKHIVHRDLKLANILVAKDFTVKLADFGFAKFAEQNSLLTSYCGTPITMAPEILTRQKYNDKCDMWSLGVIIYQMLFGCYPFYPPKGGNIDDLIKIIQTQPVNFLMSEAEISPDAQQLIKLMLKVDTNERISFESFFQHSWIKSICGKQLDKELQSAYQSTQIQKLIHKQNMESQQNLQMYKENKQNSNEKKKEKDQTVNKMTSSQTEIENYYLFYKTIEQIMDKELQEILEKCDKIQETIQKFSDLKTFEPDAVQLNIYLLLLSGLDLINDTMKKELRICFEVDEETCKLRDIFNLLKFGLDKEKLLKEKFQKMYEQVKQMEMQYKEIIEQYKSNDFNRFSCEEMLYKLLLELGKSHKFIKIQLGEVSILNECAKIVNSSASIDEYQALMSICEVLKLQGLSDTYEIKLDKDSTDFQLSLSKFTNFEEFWKEKKFGKAELNWNKMENDNQLPNVKFEKKFEISSRGTKSKMNEATILIEIFLKRLEDLENEN